MGLIGRVALVVGAGLAAGSAVGVGEALWVLQSMMPAEYAALGYAALLYGLAGGVAGLGVGVLLAPWRGLPPARRWTVGFSLVAAGFGAWTVRTVLDEQVFEAQGLPASTLAGVVIGAVVVGGLSTWLGTNLLTKTPLRVVATARGTLVLWFGGVGLAGLFSAMPAPGATGVIAAHHPQDDGLRGRPDVLLVVVSSLRTDATAPALQALAADGVVFDEHIAASSASRTALASIFTGLDPSAHGCTAALESLRPEARTLAEVLQDAGYATGGLPASPELSAAWGLGQGFDWYPYSPTFPLLASESAAMLQLYQPMRRAWERLVPTRTVREVHPPVEDQLAAAGAFTSANPDERWFLFVHLADPGEPWFVDGERLDRDAAPERIRTAYGAEVQHTDEELGRFLDGLRAQGRYEGMLIVVTADHGLELGEHGAFGDGGTLYEEQLRVPLVVKLPGNQRAGTRVSWQVRQIDIAPTIAELAGVDGDPTWQGQPLFDDAFDVHLAESGRSWAEQDASRPALSEQDARGYRLQSLRRYGQKVIEALRVPPGNPRRQPPVQFFDLEQDPGEALNLDGQGLTDAAAMQAALEELVQERRRQAVGVTVDMLDGEERARQCALGYLSGADCVR